jgi:hypothetical protein
MVEPVQPGGEDHQHFAARAGAALRWSRLGGCARAGSRRRGRAGTGGPPLPLAGPMWLRTSAERPTAGHQHPPCIPRVLETGESLSLPPRAGQRLPVMRWRTRATARQGVGCGLFVCVKCKFCGAGALASRDCGACRRCWDFVQVRFGWTWVTGARWSEGDGPFRHVANWDATSRATAPMLSPQLGRPLPLPAGLNFRVVAPRHSPITACLSSSKNVTPKGGTP